MPRACILLDSNVYFRLARSIHPLLAQEFGGENRYCLYVIAEFALEFEKSARLQHKFTWVNDPAYQANRKRLLQLSTAQGRQIHLAFDIIANMARVDHLGASAVDIRGLATAYVLGIPVVTDDQDMLKLAAAFGVEHMHTLELLRLMRDTGHIDMESVRQIAGYWQYEKDVPANFARNFQQIFGEPSPEPL